MKFRLFAPLSVVVLLLALAATCGGDGQPSTTATQTPAAEPADAEIILPDQPSEGFDLSDPSFKPLEGAEAFFDELGGTVYAIEMPDDWNGRLVLWAHGFRGLDPELVVDMPPIREYLIENGYAWAASSYSANGFVPFEGAHETAALHDFFIQEFGQPDYTYIAGGSMGGNVTLLSLELFPSRYDGALAACSSMGLGELDFIGHYVVLGAYAAGVTQEEFDSIESITELGERILLTLQFNRKARDLFENLVATLTGGPRPFRHEGFEDFYLPNFLLAAEFAPSLLDAFDNTEFVYPGDPASGISAEEVNQEVVRVAGDPQVRNADPNLSDLSGAVPIPLLMIHTTGDGWVPISGMKAFRRLADAAGNGDLLVQRAVRARGHCDFSDQELIRVAEDLMNWVENGVKPEGEDLLGPLEDAGLDFTDPLREGDPGGL
jgi:pimeloyl-ACP methyl ester carboxylesterase